MSTEFISEKDWETIKECGMPDRDRLNDLLEYKMTLIEEDDDDQVYAFVVTKPETPSSECNHEMHLNFFGNDVSVLNLADCEGFDFCPKCKEPLK